MNEYQDKAFNLLQAFTAQRPGLEFACYGDIRPYRQDARQITRQLHDFRTLFAQCKWRNFTPDEIRDAFRHSFSGRLTLHETAEGMPERLSYCAGQYEPTEYRAAACAVLASLLWDRQRESAPDVNAGDWIRAQLRKEYGRGIASRWFN